MAQSLVKYEISAVQNNILIYKYTDNTLSISECSRRPNVSFIWHTETENTHTLWMIAIKRHSSILCCRLAEDLLYLAELTFSQEREGPLCYILSRLGKYQIIGNNV